MEQLFWRSNTRKICWALGSLADNFLLCEHHLSLRATERSVAIDLKRSLRGRSPWQPRAKLRDCFTSFAMTISVKSLRFLAMTSFLRFLAKISNASHKSSSFSGVEGRPCFRKDSRLFGVLPKGRDGRPWKVAPTRFARTPNEFRYLCFERSTNVRDCTVETVPTNTI